MPPPIGSIALPISFERALLHHSAHPPTPAQLRALIGVSIGLETRDFRRRTTRSAVRRTAQRPRSGGRLIPFTKAHACGNDFLIVTEEAAAGHDRAALTRRLCERNTGIGADGIEFFAWINESGPGPRPAASASTTPTAPSPKSAATARAAWPPGWPSRSARRPGDTLEITTDAGLRVCRIDSVRNDDEFTVEVTTGNGRAPVRARTRSS